jgi:hypothetical protein
MTSSHAALPGAHHIVFEHGAVSHVVGERDIGRAIAGQSITRQLRLRIECYLITCAAIGWMCVLFHIDRVRVLAGGIAPVSRCVVDGHRAKDLLRRYRCRIRMLERFRLGGSAADHSMLREPRPGYALLEHRCKYRVTDRPGRRDDDRHKAFRRPGVEEPLIAITVDTVDSHPCGARTLDPNRSIKWTGDKEMWLTKLAYSSMPR